MTFHTTPQFHATISHHTLSFTTPFCTTSHFVVHPGHRHSTSYNIPFHITLYSKYISSVASFKSALKTVPSRPLVSISKLVFYAQSRAILIWTLITLPVCVKLCAIAFVRVCVPATLLSSTPHSVFTSHQTILHHTTFHVTPFHTTPLHITSIEHKFFFLLWIEHKFFFLLWISCDGMKDNVHGGSVSVWLYYLFIGSYLR